MSSISLREGIQKFFEVLLDLIAPPRKTQEAVRALTLEDLQSIALSEPLPYRNSAVRALVWELKYRANPQARKLAGALLAEELLALAGEEIGTPLLIPVPMHPARRMARGWNQTELLCEAALSILRVEQKESRKGLHSATARGLSEFSAENSRTLEGLLSAELFQYEPAVLVRTRATVPQQGLPKFVRLKNVKNSMRVVRAEKVRGRACVVVDDVTTTGATFAEARRALKAAGARTVQCLSLARS